MPKKPAIRNTDRAELAKLLARVLAHPALPPYLYNRFSQATNDFFDRLSERWLTDVLDSEEVIYKALEMDAKGGAR